ncbi:MAG: hypothetical protein AAFQ82_11945 [Myxococcota bacterium]
MPPKATVQLGTEYLDVWAETYVPARSRKQAAYAMVDAIARGELATYIEAQLEESMEDRTTLANGSVQQELKLRSMQLSEQWIGDHGPLPHGERIVEGERGEQLHVWTRIRIPRADWDNRLENNR